MGGEMMSRYLFEFLSNRISFAFIMIFLMLFLELRCSWLISVLTAVFAVKYQPSRNAEWALRAMRRCHITPVLAVRSSNVTPGLIKRKFGVDAKVVYPDVSTRLALAQLAAQQGETPNVIVCREGLLPLAESVVGSRRMVRAVRTATVLSYIGALCGVLLAYYLTSVGYFAVLTPLAMVVFLLLWLLPTLLIAGLVRYF